MKIKKSQEGVKYSFNKGGAMANAIKAVVGSATCASGGTFVGGALQAVAGIGQTIYGMKSTQKKLTQLMNEAVG